MESHEPYSQSTRAGMGSARRRRLAPPNPFSNSVALGNPLDPFRVSPKSSAPSQPFSLQRHYAADACGIAPRMNPRSALPGVVADACGIAPRMNPRSALPGVVADACGIAPRLNSRGPAPDAATLDPEGALAHPHNTLNLR